MERYSQAPGKMGSGGWLAAVGNDQSRETKAWNTKPYGIVTIILTLEIQHKCATGFLRKLGASQWEGNLETECEKG